MEMKLSSFAHTGTKPTLSASSSRRRLGQKKHQPSANDRLIVACSGDSSTKSEGSSNGGPSSLLSLFCPLLKVFGTDPSSPAPRWLNVTTSGLASISRLPYGTTAGRSSSKRSSDPSQLPVVYEFEACPFCRRVREAVTDLDLTVMYCPCPKGSIRHRDEVLEKGGKAQFPFMVDPNTGAEIYESRDIVEYLYATYGGGESPPSGMLETTLLTGWMPTLLRAGRGMSRFEKAIETGPQEALELYNYENNQFSRLVRFVEPTN